MNTKKFATILSILTGLIFTGAGCEINKTVDIGSKENTTPTIKDTIENWNLYKPTSLIQLVPGCDEYVDFMEIVDTGGIEKLVLFFAGNYNLELYRTPNYNKWTTQQFKSIEKCIDGAGVKGPLKAFDDYLLWGYPLCSAGVAPAADEAGYEDFQSCLKIEAELNNYLNN